MSEPHRKPGRSPLLKDVVLNVGHTAVAKVLLVVVQLATSILLARTLSADDYGVVGFANVLIALMLPFRSAGLAPAVIRSPDLREGTLNTAATLNALLALAAFVLAQLCAPVVGWLLVNPAAVPVTQVLAFGFLLAPLGFRPHCLLTREMRFAALRVPSTTGAVVRGIIAVALALTGWRYWSLVLGSLAGTLVSHTLLQVLRPSRGKLSLDREQARRLLAFGVPLASASLIALVVLHADTLLIGYFAGTTIVGLYTVAFTWATFANSTLHDVVHSVLLPAFSQLQSTPDRLRTAYLRSLRIVAFVTGFVNVAMFVVADSFLYNVLGRGTDRWLPAAGVLRVLCVYGIIRATVETVANPILVLGNTSSLLKATSLAASIELIFLPFIVPAHGMMGAAVLVTLAYAGQAVVYLPFLFRRLQISYRDLVTVLLPITMAAIGGAIIASALPLSGALTWKTMMIRLVCFSTVFTALHELVSRGSIVTELRHLRAALLASKAA